MKSTKFEVIRVISNVNNGVKYQNSYLILLGEYLQNNF